VATTTEATRGRSSATKVIEVPPVGPWQDATVVDIRDETPTVKTFRLSLRNPQTQLAGQHYLVRLTAPDGYRAQRSYSIASPPDSGNEIELAVERLRDGEVSGYLHSELTIGDTLEVRGPIGGWFVWDGTTSALLVGGGSGVVPLMAMLRLARRVGGQSIAHLVVSARTPQTLIYADELAGDDVTVIYTREQPAESSRPIGRLTVDDLAPLVRSDATCYICGSTGFADAASEHLVAAGVQPDAIRVERFGPTS
jgi:ferredoxin-NADP reductase